jgi:NAD(P)-dependent dehydrogenase (short-subunit alcohol dehydrogenase family)
MKRSAQSIYAPRLRDDVDVCPERCRCAIDGVQASTCELGGLDILINNVGAVKLRLAGFLGVTDEEWLASLNLNLLAAVRSTRAALPEILKRGQGNIVTVSSVNALLPEPGIIEYTASKAALTNFSKSISKEFGPKGTRAKTVSPGPVETALWPAPRGVAATVAKASGTDQETARRQIVDSQAGFATGRLASRVQAGDAHSSGASKRASDSSTVRARPAGVRPTESAKES